jgi:uncharacterized protein (DUF1501 family)
MRRRSFTKSTLGSTLGLAIGSTTPSGWLQTASAMLAQDDTGEGQGRAGGHDDRILVVIQLSGGNDGLNTVVPYRDEIYRKARPELGIPTSDVLKLNQDLGLHPSMRSIENLLNAQRWSVVQGVGYESANRSHFESMDIWHTCQTKKERANSGWLGRWVAEQPTRESTDAIAVHLGAEQLPLACQERGVQVPSLASLEQMRLRSKSTDTMQTQKEQRSKLDQQQEKESHDSGLLDFVSASTQAAIEVSERLEKVLAAPDATGDFPGSSLGEKLRAVSRLILAGVRTRVYYVSLDGFDTHANQPQAHAGLLRQWTEALSAFLKKMQDAGQQERVLVVTFSEFGRRVAENASQGTDHGAAAPMFLAGPVFPKVLHGLNPDLSQLDDGDLRFSIDFRSVYAAVLESWLGTPSHKALAGDYSETGKALGLFS